MILCNIIQYCEYCIYATGDIVMQEDDTITKHARAFASGDYFLFPKLKEHLSGTRFSSDSDVETAAEYWLNGKGRDFCQAGLNKLVLLSYKCLNRFGDHVEK
ncbi:hypothetical protein AVEN_173600-1 [Araneus ventricosus]|uniref:Uncharacterized protein n=1 Tax=Araneus ventricosus TaxID=182803 RepID=A0A4Y2CU96_ARAVE|nr:hypothetical protein AVEN_173600-1 [Araneus ventricosus]